MMPAASAASIRRASGDLSMTLSTRRLLALAFLAAGLAMPALADDAVVYPARVTTMQGRIFPIQNLEHEFEEGSFLYYDGETEGRVQWRDLDRVTFIGNLGHQPGANAPRVHDTRRATLRFLDGSERQVNVVMGRVFGNDGIAERDVRPENIAVIDFDEVKIAPKLFKTCLRGHVWEQSDYHYCPYDGLSLEEKQLR
jgi:hypothetical protein